MLSGIELEFAAVMKLISWTSLYFSKCASKPGVVGLGDKETADMIFQTTNFQFLLCTYN